MEYVTLITPNGVERSFEKKIAEKMLCIQIKRKIPKNKSWSLTEGYKMEVAKVLPSCNCGVKITKITITKSKTVKK